MIKNRHQERSRQAGGASGLSETIQGDTSIAQVVGNDVIVLVFVVVVVVIGWLWGNPIVSLAAVTSLALLVVVPLVVGDTDHTVGWWIGFVVLLSGLCVGIAGVVVQRGTSESAEVAASDAEVIA